MFEEGVENDPKELYFEKNGLVLFQKVEELEKEEARLRGGEGLEEKVVEEEFEGRKVESGSDGKDTQTVPEERGEGRVERRREEGRREALGEEEEKVGQVGGLFVREGRRRRERERGLPEGEEVVKEGRVGEEPGGLEAGENVADLESVVDEEGRGGGVEEEGRVEKFRGGGEEVLPERRGEVHVEDGNKEGSEGRVRDVLEKVLASFGRVTVEELAKWLPEGRVGGRHLGELGL